MIIELSDRRIICALRMLDAPTGQPLQSSVQVTSPGVRIVRNRGGLYVLTDAPGFAAYTREFESPPVNPAVGTVPVTVEVQDPNRRYLPRRATLALPRDPNPANAAQASSLFQPVSIRMFPSASLTPLPTWAVVQAIVRRAITNALVPGALLIVREPQDGGRVLGRGLAGPFGEALVAVAGIPMVRSGEAGDVIVRDIPVTIEAIVDPNASDVPDPDDLEARREALLSNSVNVNLAAGQRLVQTITVPANP